MEGSASPLLDGTDQAASKIKFNPREFLRKQRLNHHTSMVQSLDVVQRGGGISIVGDNLMWLCGQPCLEQIVGTGTSEDAFQSEFF